MRRAVGGSFSVVLFSFPLPPCISVLILYICRFAMFAQSHISSANVWPLLACAFSLPVPFLFHYVYTYSWSLFMKYQDLLSLHYDHCCVYLPFAHFQSGSRCSRTDVLWNVSKGPTTYLMSLWVGGGGSALCTYCK